MGGVYYSIVGWDYSPLGTYWRNDIRGLHGVSRRKNLPDVVSQDSW